MPDEPEINPPAKREGQVCPKCGSAQIVRSRRRNRLERMFTFLGVPYRCIKCHAYFNLRPARK